MAVISPPAYLQSGSHSAQGDRQVLSALAGQDIETFTNGVSATGVGHGLVRSGHLAVSEKSGTPDMSVDVSSGIALVTGSSSLAQGIYVFSNDATVNVAIATADATNPRYDLVIAQIRDNTEDSGGNNDAQLAVVTGTPAASPADPSVPDGCLVLARVEVAALASSIVDADITPLAGLARGSNWNQAWGVVGHVQVTANQTGIGSPAQVVITGLSRTFTAIAGRLYHATWSGGLDSNHGAIQQVFLLAALGSGGAQLNAASAIVEAHPGPEDVEYIHGAWTGTLTPGSVTIEVRCAFTSGAGNSFLASATSPGTLTIQDIGPA